MRVLHILDACDAVHRFVTGRTRGELESDELLQFALVRAVEVIGEAATRISEDTRAEIPDVPWSDIVGMRNRLIHAYFEIDSDILWRTATEDVPALASALAHVRRDTPFSGEPNPENAE